MATAVKNTPDTTAPSLFDRPAAVSLVGVVYVIGCLGIVFKLLPYLFWDVLKFDANSIAAKVVVATVLFAAAVGLIILGLWLLGPRAARGARAGIFVGAVGILVVLLLTRWASIWLEHWAMLGWFNSTVGAVLTAAVGLALLAGAGYLFLLPRTEAFLVQFEDQGWFSTTRFKSQQGFRVRLGTIVGILLIVVAGLWTMYSHGTLARLPMNWELNVPFTGRTDVNTAAFENNPVDQFRLKKLRDKFGGADSLVVDNFALRDLNRDLSNWVQVDVVGASSFDLGSVVSKSKVDEAVKELRARASFDPSDLPTTSPIPPVYGSTRYDTVQVLPLVPYTLLFLLAGLALWGAWRVVNYPAFADFLIATEAELNKVSWTTRRKLVQDTIVVLVTVFLMAVYLFAMDQVWSQLLSSTPIRVIQFQEDANKTNKTADQKPW